MEALENSGIGWGGGGGCLHHVRGIEYYEYV